MNNEIILKEGEELSEEFEVKEEHAARVVGSGNVDVLSTPSMISFMENVCWKLAQRKLPEGKTTVGTRVDVYHLKPVPIGEKIRVYAKLLKIEGRKLVFSVEAYLNNVLVGKGTHERFLIDERKFLDTVRKMRTKSS